MNPNAMFIPKTSFRFPENSGLENRLNVFATAGREPRMTVSVVRTGAVKAPACDGQVMARDDVVDLPPRRGQAPTVGEHLEAIGLALDPQKPR